MQGLAAGLLLLAASALGSRPNIVYMLIDDLGFNDVQVHGSNQIPTPNIQELADGGLRFNRFYVAPVCSPTRSSLNSGRHITHTGIYTPFPAGSTSSLNTTCNKGPLPDGSMPPRCPLLPEVLGTLGYSRYMIGKWHLGLSNWDVTPLGRGFDQYHGYLNGAEEYFDHSTSHISDGGNNPLYWGYDFWNNTVTADPATYNGSYSTTVFADWAVETIQQHASQAEPKPMYMYLAFQAVHMPLMAPQAAIDKFNATIADPRRRTFAAMANEMDTAVGRVVSALKAADMLDNTIIVLTTDNGGPACDEDGSSYDGNCASNMPLRGRKFTITEGGVRGVGLINSPLLAPSFRGASTEQLVQVTDWYFTLATAAIQGAGGSMADLPESQAAHNLLYHDQPAFEEGDGRDQWAWLSSGDESLHNRTWMMHTIAPDLDNNGRPQGAIMNGTMKLITGDYMWLGGPKAWIHTPGLNFTGPGAPKFTVSCPAPPAVDTCKPAVSPCLFDLEADPCEHVDISLKHPETVKAMRAKLDQLALARRPDLAKLPPIPDECAPQNTGGVWKVCGGVPPTAH